MRAARFGAVVSAIGTVIATYLLAIRYAVYSSIGPIPVALIGVIGSLVLLVASVHYLRTRSTISLNIWVLAAVVGAAIEIVLVAIQAFAIGAWCGWCLMYGLTIILSAIAAIIAAVQAERAAAAR
jgi:uncharacterized membrane protein